MTDESYARFRSRLRINCAVKDGTAFEGNRYVDRFTVRDGLIVSMEVWNDSAERLLERQGGSA